MSTSDHGSSPSLRSRKWCFTINNPDDSGETVLARLNAAEYAVLQLESAPTTGTPHLQGYVRFRLQKTLSAVKKLLCPSAHLEVARGDDMQNKEYCSKPGALAGPWEHGVPKQDAPGKRNDWAALLDDVKSGSSDLDLLDKYPQKMILYGEKIKRVKMMLLPKERPMPEVIVNYGGTGLGKSYWAREYLAEHGEWWNQPPRKWWDGYTGQPGVLIDEFSGQIPCTELNQLCDAAPYSVEVKGGVNPIVATHIVINTNFPPWLWYSNERTLSKLEAFCRRVKYWHYWTGYKEYRVFTSYVEFQAEVVSREGATSANFNSM